VTVMRYLQLAALMLVGTVAVSVCLLVNDAPARRSRNKQVPNETPLLLPSSLERTLLELKDPAGEAETLPSYPSDANVPSGLPPALEELRRLELGARSMLLY
jgi:hypothetical protein